ncbi:MAG: 23S rRNA (adenine(2503)-C(2))-methyltransferase RlmN [Lachnospiraceae bacterium]|nr:23S rRNA (adenine(2503)-C(2))-methyltransferase RlmN [Lachnospiraceae bacterium]
MDLRSLKKEELREMIMAAGFEGYRADQIYGWIHEKYVPDMSAMGNVPGKLKAALSEKYHLSPAKVVETRKSREDGTVKKLLSFPGDAYVETVFMRYSYGASVCVSSQVGCRMGCVFCASQMNGYLRDLTPGEMLEEIYSFSRETGERISHVVVMGTGEPMDNLDNVMAFLEILSSEDGTNMSRRDMTVSTCGVVPGIRRLAGSGLKVTLAVSLHAPTDKKRVQIMPSARKYSIAEISEACIYYREQTGRRVTLEYSLAAGFNDSMKDADDLAALASDMRAHVNLIRMNPVSGSPLREPDPGRVQAFRNRLEKKGISVTIRRELGRDIQGSCGQLRRYMLEGSI